jgi:hypothetical protein
MFRWEKCREKRLQSSSPLSSIRSGGNLPRPDISEWHADGGARIAGEASKWHGGIKKK